MQTFQRPLSEEEELYYLSLLSGKDEAKRQEARQILIERNLRLVAHMLKKYQNLGEDPEDLISIGTIGLIKAIQTFDASKKSKLATYAARCIDNELLMMLRAKKKTARDVSIYEPVGTDKEGNEICLLDVMLSDREDFSQSLIQRETYLKLREFVNTRLEKREKEIITLRYGLYDGRPMTQKQVGDMLNISRSYVSRIEKKAIRTLKNAFEEDML